MQCWPCVDGCLAMRVREVCVCVRISTHVQMGPPTSHIFTDVRLFVSIKTHTHAHTESIEHLCWHCHFQHGNEISQEQEEEPPRPPVYVELTADSSQFYNGWTSYWSQWLCFDQKWNKYSKNKHTFFFLNTHFVKVLMYLFGGKKEKKSLSRHRWPFNLKTVKWHGPNPQQGVQTGSVFLCNGTCDLCIGYRNKATIMLMTLSSISVCFSTPMDVDI